jgi:dihydroorotate dehydrogenase electron transfer subunit
MTARKLQEQGVKVQAVLGFGSRADVFGLDLFAALGIEPVIATMDGSIGTPGTVLDAIDAAGLEADLVMSCGPSRQSVTGMKPAMCPWRAAWPAVWVPAWAV